jgi:hypothetical protein
MSNALLTKPSLVVFALLTFAATSCKKTDVAVPANTSVEAPITPATPAETVSSEELASLVAYVKESTGEQNVSYNAASATFVIDNDAQMGLEDARQYYAQSQSTGTASTESVQHRRSYYVVARNKANVIKVYADASLPAVWLTALDRSIANWNAAGSYIKMTRVTSNVTGAILVKAANTGATGIIATTYYPDYNSNPGKSCTINTNYSYISSGQQVFAITHELGHALGFGHTNSTYGSLVPGSPNSDGQSIMNSVCLNWSAFTTYDLLAVRTIYPL